MKRYYFMVRFLPEQANLALLTGRCISVMHGFICKHDIQGLGVSFPAWSDASIGNMIAFVHTNMDVLKELSLQGYFQDMQECGFFKVSDVEAVPDGCAEVRFKRNQAIAKMFVGETRRRLKRLEKRALARGEVCTPNKSKEPRELDCFHCIAIASTSTEQDFLLHVQKESVQKPEEAEFSQYGLATNKVLKGTVPDFSMIRPYL
ncbi:type I-F CRISPR-associated endoribonuclease Cas6/Csy4 [Shewanella kaireitica]|uniref:type I-F CRISPR-associated endoribonuclease Cas6/Csy4 n=1 Tax=Shewanella kaireitica TaxID=212021 RepID=UPI00200CBE34|nr:type I-F CRISPR-associated endoribonuclease Cas6/Csy4 [Shewanella kaireitica]MCL1092786.1 type I-F CRISPR-associated endoribonuclease Cas6/Csy4 [Shewanella kaireitica]